MNYIYLISCQRYCKIGITGDVPSRLAQLYTGNPFDMDVVVVYEYANAGPVEQSIHQRFWLKKVRGEWFNLTDEDVETFKRICELLGGNEVSYEDAVSEYAYVEPSKIETWRIARKNMSATEIVDISNSSIEDIVAKYSVSERTASNWRAYARRDSDELNIKDD